MSLSTKAYKVTIRHPMWPGRTETFHFHDLDASQRFMKFWIAINGDADFGHVLHHPGSSNAKVSVSDCGPAMAAMSLRDYFAAKAMQAEIITSCSDATPQAARDLVNAALLSGQTAIQRIAFNAYRMADEMLKAREQA